MLEPCLTTGSNFRKLKLNFGRDYLSEMMQLAKLYLFAQIFMICPGFFSFAFLEATTSKIVFGFCISVICLDIAEFKK